MGTGFASSRTSNPLVTILRLLSISTPERAPRPYEEDCGRYGDAYRTDLRRNRLVARMTDVKEIGDALAVSAREAHHLGRFREAEAHATACIERARGLDSGSYLHGLTWRVADRKSVV